MKKEKGIDGPRSGKQLLLWQKILQGDDVTIGLSVAACLSSADETSFVLY